MIRACRAGRVGVGRDPYFLSRNRGTEARLQARIGILPGRAVRRTCREAAVDVHHIRGIGPFQPELIEDVDRIRDVRADDLETRAPRVTRDVPIDIDVTETGVFVLAGPLVVV